MGRQINPAHRERCQFWWPTVVELHQLSASILLVMETLLLRVLMLPAFDCFINEFTAVFHT